MKKRLSGLSKKKTGILVGVLSIAVLGTATFVSLEMNNDQEITEAAELLSDYQLKVAAINNRLDSYLLSEGFLAEKLTEERLTEEKKLLTPLLELESSKFFDKAAYKDYQKKLTLSKEYLDELAYKLEKQNALNDFFEEPVLNGSAIEKEGIVKEESKELTLDLEDNQYKDKWSEAIVQLYDLAKVQINAMNEAEKSVATLFSQGQVEDSVTREEYEKVQKQVNELKNIALKEKLLNQINPVLQLVEKNEDSAKKIAAEEEASAIGGIVEKQNDGSYIVVTPPESEPKIEPVEPAESSYTEPVSDGNKVVENKSSEKTSSTSSKTNSTSTTSPKTESATNKSTETSSTNKKESTKPSSESGSSTVEWESTSELTGGDLYGGIYDSLEDIPGLETGNPPWEE